MSLLVRSIACIFAACVCLASHSFAEGEEIQEEKKTEKKDETEITVNFSDDSGIDSEQEYNSGFGRLFNNPSLASGLSSGSALINRSIESLMEVVFYNLLDQELKIHITDDTVFKVGVSRDVYPTPTGAFVVVDRFSLGPEYAKEIAKVKSVPISLGVDGKVGVFDIYLKTDGTRLAEQEELSFWRSSLNNMFGLIPLLSTILPPSFNPNEMYDPANLLEAPFSFPITIGGFRTMPIGSIRSYNVSGGVNLPIDFASRLPKDLRDRLNKADSLMPTLPYSVFVEGEYRINVLRRSKNIAWVGLTRVKRLGNRVSAGVGRTLELLDKIVLEKWWSGVPAKLFPLDAQWAKAKANIFNQLYEFDLRRVEARRAYELAVKGDFTVAAELHKKQIDLSENTGVSFHFTRTERANESLGETATNLILLSSELENSRSESEIEVTDDQGKFFFLRSKSEVGDSFTEALTGKQRDYYHSVVEMKVVKAPDPDNPKDKSVYIYKFDETAENPIQLTMSYRIQDRYVDAHEYRNYLQKLRFFTALPLGSAPDIPRRDPAQIEERVVRTTLSDPSRDHLVPHVTPTYLGRFDTTSALLFNTEQINTILQRTDDEKWEALAQAYGANVKYWSKDANRHGFRSLGKWLRYLALRPFRLVNIRNEVADFISEASQTVQALNEVSEADTPMEKLAAFDDLFKTFYPDKLAKALYLLSDREKVPRSVTFNTSAKGSANRVVKRAFEFLRNKIYRSVTPFPPVERSRLADEKLNAFYPDEMRERRLRPVIRKVDVRMATIDPKDIPEDMLEPSDSRLLDVQEEIKSKHVKVRLYVKNASPAINGKIYIRIGEAGKVQLGKFLLGEKVFEVKPTVATQEDPGANLGLLIFEFYLTGPLSPFAASLYSSSFAEGGEYQVDLGLSNDGKLWSDERSFRFQFLNGRLAPPP